MITELVGRKTRISGTVTGALDKNLNKKVNSHVLRYDAAQNLDCPDYSCIFCKGVSCKAEGRDECVDLYGLG